MKNAENYGFILRYAKDKTDKTGIMYEPWHLRYVGKELAKDIYNNGVPKFIFEKLLIIIVNKQLA